jgi:hypothetical protein
MGTVLDAKFVDVYVGLAFDYRLPAFLPRVDRALLEGLGMGDRYERYARVIERLEEKSFPIFDYFNADSLSFTPGTGPEHNAGRIEGLKPGLSYLIIHAAEGGPELRSITGDWRQRDEEHRIYADGTMEHVLEREKIHTVGMSALRDLVRPG